MQRLRELDALRGLAACAVALFFHQSTLTADYGSGIFSSLPPIALLYEYGWTFVDLFFVLSGFVFCHVYGTGLERNSDGFFLARFARIYPLHFVTLLACALVAGSSPAFQNDAYHFLLNILMLQGSGLDAGMSFNFPSWTLTIEFACYIAFYVLAKRGWLIAFAIVAVPAFTVISIYSGEDMVRYARGMVGFFSGCLIFRYGWRSGTPLMAMGATLLPWANAGVTAALLFFVPLVLLAPYLKFLKSTPLVWLGDLSLSIYLLHIPVYMAFAKVGLTGYPALPLAILAIIGLSHFSFKYFETPARIAIRRYPLGNTAEGAVKPEV